LKVLVTGICGFAGSHLADLLLAEGSEVSGTVLPGESTLNIQHIGDRLTLREADLTDARAVERVMAELEPEAVYHLAGLSSVGKTWGRVESVLRVNALGMVNLVKAADNFGKPPVLVVGSGEMYGAVEEENQPISEREPMNPVNPYALSKVWQEEAAGYFMRAAGCPLIITRPFNHTGPRQSTRFVCSDFASQLAAMEAGKIEPVLKVGNLKARRDFLDVRDVVSAYRLAMDRARPGVPYNIASGHPSSIRDVLDMLLARCRVRVEVRVEEERLRPLDVPLLSGDSRRFVEETGWAPARKLEETLDDLLRYWRGSSAKEGH
jgi:GDP-4-dehydro-6-deoxy-D-mannose reductase